MDFITPRWREVEPLEKTQSHLPSTHDKNDPASPTSWENIFPTKIKTIWSQKSTRNQLSPFHFAWNSYTMTGLGCQQDIGINAKLLHADRSKSPLGTGAGPEVLWQGKLASEKNGSCKAWLYTTSCFENWIGRHRQLKVFRMHNTFLELVLTKYAINTQEASGGVKK